MSDRELLEKAAKAAGHRITWGEKYQVGNTTVDCTDMLYVLSDSPDESPCYWNPLEDDGDALRLAVKLRMDLHFEWNGPTLADIVEVFHSHEDEGHSCKCEMQQLGTDPNAAARRAIVRAAAAIGEAA